MSWEEIKRRWEGGKGVRVPFLCACNKQQNSKVTPVSLVSAVLSVKGHNTNEEGKMHHNFRHICGYKHNKNTVKQYLIGLIIFNFFNHFITFLLNSMNLISKNVSSVTRVYQRSIKH